MSYDPYKSKVSEPINVQPVDATIYNGAPTYANPVGTTTSVRAEPAHQSLQTTIQVARPLPGKWKDSICDWPQNLYPSCFCACCCCYGMWLIAQISQKTGYAQFNSVIYTTIAVWIIGFILAFFIGSLAIWWIPFVFSFIFALMLRLHVARHENITELGCFGEFCCGFWCWYCSIAQMARHLYGYTKVLDGDGDPYRSDNYGPVTNV